MPLTQRQKQIVQALPVNQRAQRARQFLQQNQNNAVINLTPRRNNRRFPVRRLPTTLQSNFDPRQTNNLLNVGNTYPPNNMIIPRNPSFQQQASNIMAIQHITIALTRSADNRMQAQTFAMRPSRHGYNALSGMFGEFRYVNLEMKFVSTSPSTTQMSVGIGYSPATHLQILNNISALSSLRGFFFGNASKSSPWTRIITPPDTTTQFLHNSSNNVGADGTNTQGYIYYSVAGGTAGDVIGNIELRGQVQFRAPI